MIEPSTRYFLDSEFMEDGDAIELLSLGVVCEDGREFYAESADADWEHANQWVRDNVMPHLHISGTSQSIIAGEPDHLWGPKRGHPEVMGRAQIAGELLKFVNDGEHRPAFWTYYGDYDWVVLCQLYGRMIDLPASWPKFALDVKQLAVELGDPRLPEHDGVEHNALADARWTQAAWEFLQGIKARRFRALETVMDLALEIYRPEGRRIWMENRNRLLDNRVPFDMVMEGDVIRVISLLTALAEGVVL